ncbi:MAG: ftsI [Gammaproteobacteria bacterium]|nr:ftsI [Gammaproteobacteria bacterium]
MKQSSHASYIAWRFYLLISLILLIVLGLILRMLDLSILKRHFLQLQGDVRVLRTVMTPGFRGMITYRNGYPLAISTSVFSIWVNPTEFSPTPQQIKSLSQTLAIKPFSIYSLLKRYEGSSHEFAYLKRDVSPDIANKVKALMIPGVYLMQGFKRYYPEVEVTAHVVGFTNVDDRGQEGLELAYNDWLTGTQGKTLVVKDRIGRTISHVRSLAAQQPGHDLVLSLDKRIQYIAYRELMAGIKSNLAESGSAIVIDVKTGEILAMVNQPSFNPNKRIVGKTDIFRNRAVTDTFEPGSTIKAFSVASALDSGKYKLDTVIDTDPGWLRIGHNVVHDEHNLGKVTIRQILQLSSNVGVTKMILSLPPAQLWKMLHQVGFGEATGIGFPGERSGELLYRDHWDPFALATLSFGYGMSATTLQLAQAYMVFADQGIKIPLSLLRVNKLPVGERVISAKVADQMLEVLEAVVSKDSGKEEQSTGKQAQIPGYRVAGKTGTARIVGARGYEKRYVSSFVGIAPVSNPRFVVAVVIRDPRGKNYFAARVSAPIFKKIMEATLHTLNVPPDESVVSDHDQAI